jgi:hypothetical protein
VTRDADTYLTEAEIQRLTGRKYAKVQARVLARQGWQFTLDGDGKPLVLRRAHDERLGVKGPPRRRRPRLEALAA